MQKMTEVVVVQAALLAAIREYKILLLIKKEPQPPNF